jgi:hypothetical protein
MPALRLGLFSDVHVNLSALHAVRDALKSEGPLVASVSIPLDHQALAAYTILSATAEGWIVEQRRVPYDPAQESDAARRRGMPPWRQGP